MEGLEEAFGHDITLSGKHPLGVATYNGKDSETLMPFVALVVTTDGDEGPEPATYFIDPDMADRLADKLHEHAAGARARHWE